MDKLFEIPEQPREPTNPNPCIALHGPGPANTACKNCVHLRYRPLRSGKRYWKCDLRRLTESASSDHRKSWPACGRYEKREEQP